MAKEAAKKKTSKKKSPPKIEKPEFGLDYVAKQLELEPATVRQRLRAAKVKKTGRTYDFKNKAGAAAVIKQLSKMGQKAEANA